MNGEEEEEEEECPIPQGGSLTGVSLPHVAAATSSFAVMQDSIRFWHKAMPIELKKLKHTQQSLYARVTTRLHRPLVCRPVMPTPDIPAAFLRSL